MNRYLLLSFFLFMFDLSSHAEFRVWRNTEGKSVTAEFKGMKDGKAVLLREDGKEFFLSPDTLCEEDQAYIKEKLSAPAQDSSEGAEEEDANQHISEAKAEVAAEKNAEDVKKEEKFSAPAQDSSEGAEEEDVNQFISKSEAKVVAEKYAEAVKNNDLVALKKLIWNPDDPERVWDYEHGVNAFSGFIIKSFKEEIKNIRIKSIKEEKYGYEVEIQIVIEDDGNTVERKGFMQMLNNGKIKYDTMGLLHPYEIICDKIDGSLFVFNDYIRDRKNQIPGCEITLFDYDEAESSTDRTLTKKKMIKWLRDEGEEWDETEPRVPCQKEVFEYWVETLRSVENR